MSDTSGTVAIPRLLFNVEETAQMLGGVSSKTVYRLVQRGLLKSSTAFRHKMISRKSIDEFIANTTK